VNGIAGRRSTAGSRAVFVRLGMLPADHKGCLLLHLHLPGRKPELDAKTRTNTARCTARLGIVQPTNSRGATARRRAACVVGCARWKPPSSTAAVLQLHLQGITNAGITTRGVPASQTLVTAPITNTHKDSVDSLVNFAFLERF